MASSRTQTIPGPVALGIGLVLALAAIPRAREQVRRYQRGEKRQDQDQGQEPPSGASRRHIEIARPGEDDGRRHQRMKTDLPQEGNDRKVGDDVGKKVKGWSMTCRQTDRRLGTLVDMLKAYRPFIHDYDWTFRTDHLHIETELLSDDERDEFGFDIDDLCWRHYWMKVQIPGLETWSIPILRGDKVYDDEPLPLLKTEAPAAPSVARAEERVSL